MQIVKYTFDVPVVAMVIHIPAKSRMAVNYVILFIALWWPIENGKRGEWLR